MRIYNVGDILICSTNYRCGISNINLVVGGKYEVIESDYFDNLYKNVLTVKNINTSYIIKYVDSVYFIPLDVYREFVLNNLLAFSSI